MTTTTTEITTTVCPKDTPWGRADGIRQIIPGIWKVYTPGHGGWYVAPELWATVPEPLQRTPYSQNGWFEEDCDWAIPCVVFWPMLDKVLEAETREAALSTLRYSYDGRFLQKMIGLGIVPATS